MKFFLLGLFMVGFAFLAEAQVSLTEADQNKTINVAAGKETDLVVSLKNNGGTPYSWKAAVKNDKIVTFEKEEERSEYKPKEGEPPMTGTPYFADFKYKFTGEAGTTKLKFDLVSYSGEIAKTVNYTIVVKGAKKKAKKKK